MFQERVLEGQGEGGVGEGDTVTLVTQEGGDQGHHTIQVTDRGSLALSGEYSTALLPSSEGPGAELKCLYCTALYCTVLHCTVLY